MNPETWQLPGLAEDALGGPSPRAAGSFPAGWW